MPRKKKENIEVAEEKVVQQEHLTLAYLVNESCKFLRGKTKEETFNLLGEKFIIRSYIPILEKMAIVMRLIFKLQENENETQELNIIELYKNLFFEVLLKEYAQVDISDDSLINYSNYDVLYPIFYPYIIQFCEQDYNIIVKMVEDSLNLYNLKSLIDMLNGINYKKIEESNKNINKMINKLNSDKEMVKNIKDILINTHEDAELYNKVVSQAIMNDINSEE